MDRAEEWDGHRVTGIDVDALSDVIRDVQRDPAKGKVEILVKTVWQGRARSETTVESVMPLSVTVQPRSASKSSAKTAAVPVPLNASKESSGASAGHIVRYQQPDPATLLKVVEAGQ